MSSAESPRVRILIRQRKAAEMLRNEQESRTSSPGSKPGCGETHARSLRWEALHAQL